MDAQSDSAEEVDAPFDLDFLCFLPAMVSTVNGDEGREKEGGQGRVQRDFEIRLRAHTEDNLSTERVTVTL